MREHRQDSISLLSLAVTLIFSLLIFPPLASSNCFYPDGDPGGINFEKCNYNSIGDADISMCCATNRNGSGNQTNDTCLPSGLCLNTMELTYENGTLYNYTSYWRPLYSTKPWGDGCLKVCTRSSVWYSAWR